MATFFLPKRLRPHFESVYAYCRVSDDLGDEVGDPATALRLLDELAARCWMSAMTRRSGRGIRCLWRWRRRLWACELPREPFA